MCFLRVLFSDYNYFSLPKQGLGLQFCDPESFFWAHGLITLGIPKPDEIGHPIGGPAVESGGRDETAT